MTLDDQIKDIVLKKISESPSKACACKELGISERTLRDWLKKWGKSVYKKTDFDCMRNLTPKERDEIENRDTNHLLSP